jgi:hypothetical protein
MKIRVLSCSEQELAETVGYDSKLLETEKVLGALIRSLRKS